MLRGGFGKRLAQPRSAQPQIGLVADSVPPDVAASWLPTLLCFEPTAPSPAPRGSVSVGLTPDSFDFPRALSCADQAESNSGQAPFALGPIPLPSFESFDPCP